jgi:hypothetical protein
MVRQRRAKDNRGLSTLRIVDRGLRISRSGSEGSDRKPSLEPLQTGDQKEHPKFDQACRKGG